MKKPNPSMLGTGAAAKAGKKVQTRQQRQKRQLDSIMREINSTKTGAKKYR